MVVRDGAEAGDAEETKMGEPGERRGTGDPRGLYEGSSPSAYALAAQVLRKLARLQKELGALSAWAAEAFRGLAANEDSSAPRESIQGFLATRLKADLGCALGQERSEPVRGEADRGVGDGQHASDPLLAGRVSRKDPSTPRYRHIRNSFLVGYLLSDLVEEGLVKRYEHYDEASTYPDVTAITVCRIGDAVGYALCSSKDQFSKAKGRRIAFARARKELARGTA